MNLTKSSASRPVRDWDKELNLICDGIKKIKAYQLHPHREARYLVTCLNLILGQRQILGDDRLKSHLKDNHKIVILQTLETMNSIEGLEIDLKGYDPLSLLCQKGEPNPPAAIPVIEA